MTTAPTAIKTSKGALAGSEERGLHVFRGIPYARPPVGDLRFRAPRPIEAWTGTCDATHFGAVAPQIQNEGLDALTGRDPQSQDEDCLYLNVWTPAADGARRPVMVWIHGGAFTIGSGSTPMYDGSALVARDVVVVTINYRLGALGFLRVPGADGDISTNWGMLDQIEALRWVRDEIAAFGGDPDNVTIFGESAGGMSVGALMGSPLASGLFQRAILESGAGHNALTVEQANETAAGVARALAVDALDPEALRALPATRILEAQAAAEAALAAEMAAGGSPMMRFQPVIDGHFLETMPIEAVRGGLAMDVSTLIGTTAEEFKLFGALSPPGAAEPTDDQLVLNAAALLSETRDPDRGRALLDAYREARATRGEAIELKELLLAAQTDQMFRVPADRFGEAQARLNPQTYSYRFDKPSPAAGCALGACHAVEIPYVFGTQRVAKGFVGEGPEVDALASRVGDAWVAFARSGDPNADALPSWPPFEGTRRSTMILDDECRVEDGPREPERRCWDGVVA